MRKTVIILAVLVVIFGGCYYIFNHSDSKSSSSSAEDNTAYFIAKVSDSTWQTSYDGTDLTVVLKSDKEGYVELPDAQKITFTYDISDVSDDLSSAEMSIKISDSGSYTQIAHFSTSDISATFENDKTLVLEKNVLGKDYTVTLTPQEGSLE